MSNENIDWRERYSNISSTLYRFFKYFESRDFERLQKENNTRKYKTHYEFVPNNITLVLEGIEMLHKLLKPRHDKYFVDAGCGIGWVLLLAERYGFKTFGIELGKANYKIAKKLSPFSRFYHGDILKHDFSKYDVVYYFCPFKNYTLELKFERKVEDEVKVGGFIFANLKQNLNIIKDKRFKLISGLPNHYDDKYSYAIWKKISN